MSKVAQYLQEHLVGEVMASVDMRRFFATDGSIFTVPPALVVYPKNENDVRKTARFTWQLAERGRVIPVTPRGLGTDTTGAAIGSGIVMVFPAHMNKIIELDSKTGVVTVEPGINFGRLQQTLQTHGRFLPSYPSSYQYSTIGGAVGNNRSGEKSIKYGDTLKFVKSLKVVLANGEIITTKRLTKREVNKKLGLSTFEGEIYRSLDKLFEEYDAILRARPDKVIRNTAGYNIWDVKRKDGSYDLTPLFVGSQGTLGFVTEAVLGTEPYNPHSTTLLASIDDLKVAEQIVHDIRELPDKPSSLEIINEHALELVDKINPNLLKDVLPKPFPNIAMLVEFDNFNERTQKRMVKKVQKIMQKYEVPVQVERDMEKRQNLWKVRQSVSTIMAHSDGNTYPVPVIEDGVVPIDKLDEYLNGVAAIFEKNNVKSGVWGHIGEGNLRQRPFLDLTQVGDRQKVFRLMDEYYKMVIELGGTTSGGHNDGRLRGVYLRDLYGDELYQIFEKIKKIFDPYGTLNPGVKVGVTPEAIRPLLRANYGPEHLYNHLPRA